MIRTNVLRVNDMRICKKHFKNSFVFVLFAFEIDETTEKAFSYFSDCSLFSDRLDWINLIRTLPIYSALNTTVDSHVLVLKSLFSRNDGNQSALDHSLHGKASMKSNANSFPSECLFSEVKSR
jgi:hypothetical protein